ncbi:MULTISPECIES: glucose 1-dehydrogenase [Cyanophyceae]|uniref:glucose 1-dehydrogenase n=1 Tax=Cyanophyceae TaxID=3028117 RepID=UPI00168A1374|nr:MULTISPECIES: glucose 1-dehydrogenase [Cyanophyceae]MBD1918335.1 glucose 1-dehydrogenase [Phormidium sp. FACHB-77]MBD2028796.1 glucose 1-dehydrogenase [Phormidium sp. FACHB-322]MBD2051217.1 glucose 1-dehydrogenase [Leptolyngbya sp. FACHB-60]
MSLGLSGKVAIVTGGSSGIGRASAIELARQGAKVVVAARRESEGEETVQQVKAAGSDGFFIKTDVTKAADVEALINQTLQAYSRLDCVFNNAGAGKAAPLIELSETEWDLELNVNLKAVWLSMKYEIPAMLKSGGGAIVNMASQGGGVIGVPNFASYTAAKGGVVALTRTAAMEFGGQGIRINCVSPGLILTDLLAEVPQVTLQQMEARVPLKRGGKAEEVAKAVVWLCSDDASYITGHNLVIDGGYTVQ